MNNMIITLDSLFANPDNRNLLFLLLLCCSLLEGFLLARRLRLRENIDRAPDFKDSWENYYRFGLYLALMLGAGLRLYGLDFGLPTPYHPDELQKAHFLRSMMAEKRIDPHFGLQPPLLLYLTWLISQVLHLFNVFQGQTIARLLLAGRAVNAVCGVISIYLVYCIGCRISSRFTGTVAALLLAIIPLHVTNSRYMKEDVLFVSFALACMLLVLKSVDQKKLKYLYLAGLFAGFSLGAKYTGVVSFLIVLAAPFLGRERFSFIPDWRMLKHSVLAILLEPIGFVLTAPYLLSSWENISQVIEGFGSESRHAMRGHMGVAISAASQLWMFHLGNSLIPGMGILTVVAALIGLGALLYSWRPKGLFLVALVLLFYLPAEWANSKPPPQPDRYVLACTPFLALAAAELLEILRRRAGLPVFKTLVPLGILFFFPAMRSFQLAADIRNDTRKQMTDWMHDNLPAGTRILLSGGTTYLARVPQKLQGVALRKKIGRENDHIADRLRATNFDYILTTSLTTGRFRTNVQGRAREVANSLREIDRDLPLVKRISAASGSYGFHNPVLSLYALKSESDKQASEPSGAPQAQEVKGNFELAHPPGWGVK